MLSFHHVEFLSFFANLTNIGEMEQNSFNSLLSGKIFHAFLSSADFFQSQLFKKFFQEYNLSLKQFGSRSAPMFCQA